MAGLLDTIAEAYMRKVGNPARQLVGGGVRGLLGLDAPEYADNLGMEAYRNAAALGNAPGINAPVGAFKAAAKVVPEAAMFIGALAKTWDKASNAKALQMEKAGKDAREIWRETGNLRGPDGKWRQEIDDSAAKLRDYNFTPKEAFQNAMQNAVVGDGNHVTALSMRPHAGMTKMQLVDEYSRTGGEIVDAALSGDKAKALQLSADRGGLDAMFGAMRDRAYGPASSYLKHGDLGAAYPDVYKLHTRIDGDLGGGTRGQYLRGNEMQGEQVVLASKPSSWNDGKSTMLHELQHAIQQREGFARGGSMDDFMRESMQAKQKAWDRITSINEELRSASGTPRYQELLQERQKLVPLAQKDTLDLKGEAYQAYRRLTGEAEARATQARMNMSPAERRAMFPYDSYDVPVDQLIVRQEGLLGPQMAVLPGALDRARGLLGEIAIGQKPKPIDIAELTPKQFAELNAARKAMGQPEFIRPTVIYNGKHHYQSRSADGDSIDEMLLQIANSLDDRAGVVMSPRGPALQSPQRRVNPRGETVLDRAVLEGGGDRPTWLYSAIPKKKAP